VSSGGKAHFAGDPSSSASSGRDPSSSRLPGCRYPKLNLPQNGVAWEGNWETSGEIVAFLYLLFAKQLEIVVKTQHPGAIATTGR
jgi:hypothetical protein